MTSTISAPAQVAAAATCAASAASRVMAMPWPAPEWPNKAEPTQAHAAPSPVTPTRKAFGVDAREARNAALISSAKPTSRSSQRSPYEPRSRVATEDPLVTYWSASSATAHTAPDNAPASESAAHRCALAESAAVRRSNRTASNPPRDRESDKNSSHRRADSSRRGAGSRWPAAVTDWPTPNTSRPLVRCKSSLESVCHETRYALCGSFGNVATIWTGSSVEPPALPPTSRILLTG